MAQSAGLAPLMADMHRQHCPGAFMLVVAIPPDAMVWAMQKAGPRGPLPAAVLR